MAAIDEGAVVKALLVDFSKAFDVVPHQKLLHELSAIGCSFLVQQWFRSYLTDRLQRVTHNGTVTEWRAVSRGVPQGGCLSPLLSNIYVRNIPVGCTYDTY